MLKMTGLTEARVVQAGDIISPGVEHASQPGQRPAGFVPYHPRAGARSPGDELDLKLVVNNAVEQAAFTHASMN
jgi:hypothetical protein